MLQWLAENPQLIEPLLSVAALWLCWEVRKTRHMLGNGIHELLKELKREIREARKQL